MGKHARTLRRVRRANVVDLAKEGYEPLAESMLRLIAAFCIREGVKPSEVMGKLSDGKLDWNRAHSIIIKGGS